MKPLLLLPLAGLLALIAGCAPAPLNKADIDGKVVCNPDAMDQVERQARREFKTIVWLRCPTATLRVVS